MKRATASSSAWRRLRLQHKLMLSYGALGALLTVLSLLGGSYVHGRSERARLERDRIADATMHLSSMVGSAVEEGFAYTVSGDVGERTHFQQRLAAIRTACEGLQSAPGSTESERASLRAFVAAVITVDDAASTMFDGYERTGSVDPGAYAGYEAAIDHAQDAVAALASDSRAQSATVESAARASSSLMTLGIGALAFVIVIALGAWLGRQMTRPLVALRDAARVFAGRHERTADPGSNDEVRQLGDAFEQMTDAVALRTSELQASMEELRTAHAALSLDRKLHQAIWDSSPLPKWIFDLETLRFLDVNHAATALYGYSREEFSKLTLAEIRQPEDVPRLLAALAARKTGQPRVGLWSHRAKDGSILEVEVTAHDLLVEGRSLVCSTVRDVTDARRVELLLAASEERYRTVFEASAMPMWIWDADTFQFIVTNEAASRLYGYSRDEFTTMTLDALIPESERAGFRERVLKAITGDFAGERTHRTKSGATVRVEVAAQHVMLDGRRCVLTAGRDVTERRNLEAQLFQAQKMEAIGRLAGGIAHDFNNILAAVLADAEWIGTQLGPDHVLFPEAVGIGTAAERGAALARQMLAFSRGQPHQPKRVQLNAVVSDTEKLVRRLLGEDVRLTCRLDPALGIVEADPSQVEQVLLNLAINARDAMPAGGAMSIATRNVDLGETRHGLPAGAYVCVSVADTGCGMDEATMARIFEPFFTTKEVGKGTGLGLSTVFGIVKQSAGAITAESEPGRGSTFTVYLPRCAQSSRGSVKPLTARRAAAKGKTVLVVEDDEHVRRVVCRQLRADGYAVVETKDVAEASGVIGDPTRTVDLVLSDIVMPGTDGVTFAEQVRSTHAHLPVLLMSGYTDKVAALEGSRPLLAKPFTPTQLSSAVREALEAA